MNVVESRLKLLPMWIKVIGWIFIVLGVVSSLAIITKVIGIEAEFSLEIFGLIYDGSQSNALFSLVTGLYLFFSISAYGLVRGKNWGLSACIVNGYIGIVVCLFVTISSFSSEYINLRLEPIIQVIYLWKLHKIKDQWSTQTET
ncbi:hypothetical protein ACMAZD_11635 [Vibrio sp. nBUS_14]|uniref:hypothetical protein n=1 Tax=Vibrio sp. nBUS_14 TaxID=3395321 RepID=UPI003EBB61DB